MNAKFIVLATATLLSINSQLFADQAQLSAMRAPWPNAEETPAISDQNDPSLGSDYATGLLYFYQNVLSIVMNSPCSMEPSCSNYSLHAVHKHGALRGILMTADRLFHEGSEQGVAPIRHIDAELRYYDPVENNDFWWYSNEN